MSPEERRPLVLPRRLPWLLPVRREPRPVLWCGGDERFPMLGGWVLWPWYLYSVLMVLIWTLCVLYQFLQTCQIEKARSLDRAKGPFGAHRGEGIWRSEYEPFIQNPSWAGFGYTPGGSG